MSFNISAIERYNEGVSVTIDKRNADECPICHQHINPIYIAAYLNGRGNSSPILQILDRCPNEDCGMTFFAVYRGVPQSGNRNNCWYFYENSEPLFPVEPDLPNNIKEISPSFIVIYTQASFSEQMNLKEICGMAYRKALEFLVKDYLIHKSQKLKLTEATIKETPLAKCIEKYIDDPMTKSVAIRATWLGNDETHYSRKWEEKDFEDCKILLRLTINSIENQLLVEKYENEMQNNKST
ncbi:MAG TPA: hypothetical protein VI461_05245 [Chitinophagaceae bacterium]|nr:hypothetical protein [Chitinophagaceae bacterium]